MPELQTGRHALAGLHVIVTRPVGQADKLLGLLTRSGASVTHFPVIEVHPCLDSESSERLQRIASYDLAIFISTNAVEQALNIPDMAWNDISLAAVGQATASRLEEHFKRPVIAPQQMMTSEGLLACAEMQEPSISGKRVLIIRGQGGREKLAQALRARGAEVDYAEVYRRGLPAVDPVTVAELWEKQSRIILVSSQEGLGNLVTLIGEKYSEAVRNTDLLVYSERIAREARQSGFCGKVLVLERISDQAIHQQLIDYWHKSGSQDNG